MIHEQIAQKILWDMRVKLDAAEAGHHTWR
jgi:hypothetical protein